MARYTEFPTQEEIEAADYDQLRDWEIFLGAGLSLDQMDLKDMISGKLKEIRSKQK